MANDEAGSKAHNSAMAVLRTAGKARRQEPIPWLGVFAIIGTIGALAAVHTWVRHHDLDVARTKILGDRAKLANEIESDRTRVARNVEAWTVALANDPWKGDVSIGKPGEGRDRPTIYLRLASKDAQSAAKVHAASQLGTLDGLSSCLLRGTAGGPWHYGEVVARSEMLGPQFVDEVKTSTNDLRMRALSSMLESYAETDFKSARDAWKRAEYVAIAIDESENKGAIRLSLRRLADGEEILRVRRTPNASLFAMQGTPNDLARAQAIGCTMANEALALVGE